MTQGSEVRLTCFGRSTKGRVAMCSANKLSIGVMVEGMLPTCKAGIIGGFIPLLRDHVNAPWREIADGTVIEVEVIQ